MSGGLIFVGTYAIPDGILEEFKVANRAMGDFVQANEPRILSWHTYLNAAGDEATTIMTFPDSAALEQHLRVAADRVRQGTQMVQTKQVDLYGDASEAVIAALQQLSAASGEWPVAVKPYFYGFSS
ncbi:MAG: hypothetical protein P8X64_12755 [Anaerolineales bacterium]|jgi:hypothetical protein